MHGGAVRRPPTKFKLIREGTVFRDEPHTEYEADWDGE
jgi:hypothetical protein